MREQSGKPGRYDEQAERILTETSAETVLLVVIEGKQGHGMSVATKSARGQAMVSAMLRMMADEIDRGAQPSGVAVIPLPGSAAGSGSPR